MVAPTAVSKAKLAVNSLRKAEESALDSSDSGAGNGGFYTGSGKDGASGKARNVKKIKRRATIGLIIALMIGGGTFLGTSNSMLAPAIEALFTEQTDTQYASATKRTSHLMRYAIQGDEVIKTNAWTGTKKYGKMSKSFKKKLANNGITIEGKGKSAKLIYTHDVTDNTGKVETKTKTIPADDFVKTINSDTDFRESFQAARRGRVATFFDNTATKILQKLGVTRNLFENFKRSSDNETNTKNFRKTMSDKFNGGETNIRQRGEKEVTEKDADGNETTKKEPIDVDETAKNTSSDMADAKVKAEGTLKSVSDKFTSIGNWGCMISRTISMISVMVAANEIYQSINYFMGMTESISKMKAGEGDASAINEVMNFFSTVSTTETNKYGKLTITNNNDKTNGTVSGGEDVVKQTGSPLESNGMQMILAGAALSTSENQLFSLERLNNMLSSEGAEHACVGVDLASAAVSIGMKIAFFPESLIISSIWSIVGKAAAGIAISAALSFIVPTIAKTLFTNAFETATGIPAGALFTKGGSATNTRLGRNASGQSLSSEKAAIAYNKVNQEVIAQDAEIDRKNLSPFDTTNKNTFFGSIAYSLFPLITSSKVTNLSSLLNTTGKSLSSLMSGKVSAAGKDTTYMTKFGKCDSLEEIGAVGDQYCNPVTSTDTSTIDMKPDDGEYQDIIAEQMLDEYGRSSCEDDGSNCSINPKSNLAKYVSYCAGRNSPFGVVDQNILGELQTSGGLGVFRGIAGAIPMVDDILDIADALENEENMSWATGEKCGNTNENHTFWEEEGKYYQRFIEDTRILEQFGAYEDDPSPLEAYNEQYEATHPTDDTYIGYMSRISGLLPENVETTLAFIDYFQYIEEYDPSVRIAMTDHPSTVETSASVIARAEKDNEHFTDKQPQTMKHLFAIFQQPIIYADIRNRSFAI